MTSALPPGANYLGDGRTRFTVWAPDAGQVAVALPDADSGKAANVVRLEPQGSGIHSSVIEGVAPGQRYSIKINDVLLPDPASKSQPDGVHGASEVISPTHPWRDGAWAGLALPDYVLYELHVGTFTGEGTFDAVVPHLDALIELGITAVELMPISQFPGDRNWGYDGVYPYAAQHSYGGLDGLRRLVDECHLRGLAVVLDVVYNHLGPEGNHLAKFGPYFTDLYHTPWGAALNFDGRGSDSVREFFIENALWWVRDCHIDALRLDAVHAILDRSPFTFLEELGDRVSEVALANRREIFLIAESSDNDVRLIRERARGGYGMNSVWADDFHHCLHTLLTGERHQYYEDYGSLAQMAKCFSEGFAYTGEFSAYLGRRHGTSAEGESSERFVVCAQNHDQVGNRAAGDRLGHLVTTEQLKLAASAVLLSPFIPLIFMGEEYGEVARFPYFISHTDPNLIQAVRDGRKQEFGMTDEQADLLDPFAVETYRLAKLDHALEHDADHVALRHVYQELLRLRKAIRGSVDLAERRVSVRTDAASILVEYGPNGGEYLLVLCFSHSDREVLPVPEGDWEVIFSSADDGAGGPQGTGDMLSGSRLTLHGNSAALLRKRNA